MPASHIAACNTDKASPDIEFRNSGPNHAVMSEYVIIFETELQKVGIPVSWILDIILRKPDIFKKVTKNQAYLPIKGTN